MDPASLSPQPSPAAQRDQDIVELLRNDQRIAAFELLAQRYEAKVYRLCVALLRDPAAAQDAAQESLIRVWKALPSYNATAALSTWIYAITRNRCFSALVSERKQLSLSDESVAAEAEHIAAASGDAETIAALRRLVEDLPETARRAIQLFYFEEHSVAEVAAMLGCPQGTVKTHLFRARAALLARLSALGLADPALWTT